MLASARRLCGLSVLFFGVPAWAGPAAPSEPYAPASACAECHLGIHAYWAESAHARAASAPSFLASLEAALAATPEPERSAVRRNCVWCHAPTTLVSGDHALEQPVTKEGVGCDFCHTAADVDLTRAGHPFDLQPGNVKRGPLQYAESPFHATAYSNLHRSSPLLCAACHEHRSAAGAPVLTTYSDWKASPSAARGEPCQECHMPLVPGTTVREGLPSSVRAVNLHRLVGGSVPSKVRSGVELSLAVSRSATSADVQVVVTNSGVGHALPGGLPTKALVLAVGVEAADGRLLHRQERVYARELRDAQGRTLTTAAEAFVAAAAVGRDTRLAPRESRQERFTLPVADTARAIVARLEYRDASDPRGEPRTAVVTEERHPLPGR